MVGHIYSPRYSGSEDQRLLKPRSHRSAWVSGCLNLPKERDTLPSKEQLIIQIDDMLYRATRNQTPAEQENSLGPDVLGK